MQLNYIPSRLTRLLSASAMSAVACFSSQAAWANCTTTGTTVVCDASAPNPYSAAIGGTDITLTSGAQVQADPFSGMSVNYDTITIYGTGGQLDAQANSTILNSYGGSAVVAGANTTINLNGAVTVTNNGRGVTLGDNAILNVGSSAVVNASGSVGTSQISSAVLVTGKSTTIQVNGTLRNESNLGGSAINMVSQDFFANIVEGTGTITVGANGRVLSNGGSGQTIILTSGSTLNVAGLVRAYTSGNAINYVGAEGGAATVSILAGGSVESAARPAIISSDGAMNLTVAGSVVVWADSVDTAIRLGNGNDVVTLVTGYSVNGLIDGGGGVNTLNLTGSGSANLSATANFANVAINAGTWTLSEPLTTSSISIAAGATGIGTASQWSQAISNAGTLLFNESTDASYTGSLSGAGQLVKTGAGTLTLGNQSAFTGSTLVSAGQLLLTGAMPSAVTVASGSTLAGNGSIAGLTVQSGGTVSPSAVSGSGVGTLSVAGTFTQAAGSTYLAQIVGSGADRIVVTGAAVLETGSTLVIATQNPVLGQSYTLLTTTGGVTGQYATVQSDVANYRLTYSNNSVVLNFGRSNANLLALAQGANQVSVANALISLPDDNSLYSLLALAQDDATVRSAYPQLTGDIHGAARATMLRNTELVVDAALTRPLAAQPGLHLWGQMLGSTGNSNGAGGAAHATLSSYGAMLGLEAGLGSVALGVAAGFVDARLNTVTGTASVNTPQFLGYLRGAVHGLSVQAGVGYARATNDLSREVAFAGFSDTDRARYKGDVLHGFGEIGVPVAIGDGSVTPFVAGRVYRVSTNAFVEQGGAAALRGGSRRTWSEMTEVGARLSTPIVGGLSAQGRLAWQHRYGAAQDIAQLSFAAGGQDFAVRGAGLSRDAAAFDLGLGWAGANGVTVGLGFHGAVGNQSVENSGRLSLSLPL